VDQRWMWVGSSWEEMGTSGAEWLARGRRRGAEATVRE
jgi:hypothetical protein